MVRVGFVVRVWCLFGFRVRDCVVMVRIRFRLRVCVWIGVRGRFMVRVGGSRKVGVWVRF